MQETAVNVHKRPQSMFTRDKQSMFTRTKDSLPSPTFTSFILKWSFQLFGTISQYAVRNGLQKGGINKLSVLGNHVKMDVTTVKLKKIENLKINQNKIKQLKIK